MSVVMSLGRPMGSRSACRWHGCIEQAKMLLTVFISKEPAVSSCVVGQWHWTCTAKAPLNIYQSASPNLNRQLGIVLTHLICNRQLGGGYVLLAAAMLYYQCFITALDRLFWSCTFIKQQHTQSFCKLLCMPALLMLVPQSIANSDAAKK